MSTCRRWVHSHQPCQPPWECHGYSSFSSLLSFVSAIHSCHHLYGTVDKGQLFWESAPSSILTCIYMYTTPLLQLLCILGSMSGCKNSYGEHWGPLRIAPVSKQASKGASAERAVALILEIINLHASQQLCWAPGLRVLASSFGAL